MAAGPYLAGVVLFGLVVAATAASGVLIRRILLPAWSGAPARLAEVVIALAIVVVVGEVVGTVGAFSRWPVVLSYVAVAVVTGLVYRRKGRAHATLALAAFARAEPADPNPGLAQSAAGAVAVALALIPWIRSTREALEEGMRNWDTLQYHMPFAALFVQDRSVTGLHYVQETPVSFYPMNSELIHAIGILVFQRDVLSPVINLGWLGLALLASWCIGRPTGVGPSTTAATALVASLPIMSTSQAGTAKNDIAALALLLAAVALLVTAPRSRPALVLAALAAGLAAGTRLNLWGPLIALGALAVVTRPARSRASAAAWWAAAAGAGSGFWYVRNLVEVGNPMPWFGGKIDNLFTLPATTPGGCGAKSIADYVTDPGFVAANLVPQLPGVLGRLWWLVLCLAGTGVICGLLSRGTPMGRGLAFTALVSYVAYVVTPTSAGEGGRCFAFNTRFAVPGLALGLILVPLVLSRLRRGRTVAAFAAILLIAVSEVGLKSGTFGGLVRVSFVSFGLVAAVAVFALGAWRALPRVALAGLVVVVGVTGVVVGWSVQRTYLHNRYTEARLLEPVESIYAVLRSTHHARVAVSGLWESYPFYGPELSNRVEYPAARKGARFSPYETRCRAWLAALRRGHYNYVVTAREGNRESPVAACTRRYPRAREVIASAPGAMRAGHSWTWQLFRIERRRSDPEPG